MITRINLLWFALFFLIVSCKAKQASVNKLPPHVIELKKYSVDTIRNESIRLVENTVFLWKQEGQMTDTQVRDIQLLSKDLEQLENDQKEIERPLNELKKIYDVEVAKLDEQQKQEWNSLPEKVATAQQTIDFNTGKLAAETDKLNAENANLNLINSQIADLNKSLEEEKAKPEVSQEKISEISKKIDELQAKKVVSEKSIVSIQKKQKKYQDKLVDAQTEYDKYDKEKTETFKDVNTAYVQVKVEEDRLAVEKQKMSERGNELVKKLTENVDLMEKPSFLSIKVIEDSIQVDLSWKLHPDCSDCDESFSTEKNNIKNVSYQEEGGLLKFELTDQQDTYSFRMVRAKEDDKLGRIFYNGDLTVNYKDNTVRYGVLKFVSGKY
jgi:chromosome segregation ATPase